MYRKVEMRCKSDDRSEKNFYQSLEVSGILTAFPLFIVIERQTEFSYIGMSREFNWVTHGKGILGLCPNLVAPHQGM